MGDNVPLSLSADKPFPPVGPIFPFDGTMNFRRLLESRFTNALLASGLIHLWLLAWLVFAAPMSGAGHIAPLAPTKPLDVRLSPRLVAKIPPSGGLSPPPTPPMTADHSASHPGPPSASAGDRAPHQRPAGPSLPYYPDFMLDAQPQPVTIWPLDRLLPLAMGRNGHVVFELKISAQGRVDALNVRSSSIHANYVAALSEILYAASFVPARKDGRAVGALITVEFQVDDAGEPPSDAFNPTPSDH
jgi:TonB family protein